jgi:hypothetical protein
VPIAYADYAATAPLPAIAGRKRQLAQWHEDQAADLRREAVELDAEAARRRAAYEQASA